MNSRTAHFSNRDKGEPPEKLRTAKNNWASFLVKIKNIWASGKLTWFLYKKKECSPPLRYSEWYLDRCITFCLFMWKNVYVFFFVGLNASKKVNQTNCFCLFVYHWILVDVRLLYPLFCRSKLVYKTMVTHDENGRKCRW